ncbi:hypothetical protein I5F12_08040 [Proteus cibarius]|uniref:hypothetical protein n=1 Tax=Proteus terrae TaxID=1574161 RepID=UPI0018C6D13F|nr:hypothetical protein [Proteus terrae]MBG6038020.1 hypothetical protein [Proteus terrae subsp. cibarius]
MKRKLIKRNKRWLMEKYYLSQQLFAPLSVILKENKLESQANRYYRLWRRGLIKEDWNQAIFDTGVAIVPQRRFDGRVIYHDRVYNKELVPLEYKKKWKAF